MNEFTKQKVAFAVAFLAVLFTITPLLQPFGASGYDILGVRLTVLRLYYFLSVVLAAAVYAYAFQFLTERDLRYPSRVGDVLYAVAIVTPALYFALFAVVSAIEMSAPLTSGVWIDRLKSVAAVILGFMSASAIHMARRAITRRGIRAQAEQLRQQEISLLRRAEQLLQAGSHKLAVLEAWKAIDAAAHRIYIQAEMFRLRETGSVWTMVERHELIPPQQLEEIWQLRRFRNAAAAPDTSVSREDASAVVATAEALVATLQTAPSDDDDMRPKG